MNVVALQFDIIWENPEANYALVEEMVRQEPPAEGDLLVLPEMFSTGFSMNTGTTFELNRTLGRSADFLRKLATSYKCEVIGGMVWPDVTDRPGNFSVWMSSQGEVRSAYQKICPFSMVGEDQAHEAGDAVTIVEWNGIRVALLICYDLRFPELFRSALARGAEMFVVIANWPAKRASHWTRLLEARAIENMAYVVGVNRTGSDPDFPYPGQSRIIDPLGEVLADAGPEAGMIRSEINPELVRKWRHDFPAYQDSLDLKARGF